jgi:hypothetical protein
MVLEQKVRNKFNNYHYSPEKINDGFRSECFKLEAVSKIIEYLQKHSKEW